MLDRRQLLQAAALATAPIGLGACATSTPMSNSPTLGAALPGLLATLLLATIGFVAVGTLFSAMVVKTRFAELMLPILLLPFMVPPLVFAVKTTVPLFAGRPLSEVVAGLRFLALYDVAFVTLSVLLFSAVVDE